jgi:hypothetical protein
MNGINTMKDFNIILLGSYDCLIGSNWREKHYSILDCYRKDFTCIDDEGNARIVKGIPRPIYVQYISTLHLKIIFRQWCKIYAVHMEEPMKDKDPSIEDYPILKEYEYVFEEFPGFSPERDIDFFIDLILEVSPMSKTSYIMSMP